ncbi:hypothetical protein ACMD2_00247 [Ananas comosus]|uniref:Uncharacterized protein n=1 Tax=Ananas comosus TaxID=4615 RepID=A0A199W2L8_ANACO|nr:hypothetical protein ACMD2_00247 [Ananas comosus]
MASAIPFTFSKGDKDIRAMHSSTVIKAYNFLIWLTIQSPILLLFYTMRYNPIDRNRKIYLISAMTISCVLLIVTSFFSLVLQNKDCAGMSLIVIPVISIIGFLGYTATQNVNDHDSADHESYKPEREKAFKFATTIATMAITVQTGMIYASFNSPPLRALQSFQSALSLFFLISMVGIFTMLATSIPLTVHYSFWRGIILSFVRYSSAAILVLLGLSAAALAMQFLGILVAGVFLLVLAPICVYFTQDRIGIGLIDPTSPRPLYHDPRSAGVIRDGFAILISINVALLATICVASVGDVPEHYYMSTGIRVWAFFQLLAIVSGLIWIGLMFEPQDGEQQHDEAWLSILEVFYYVSLLLQIFMIMAGTGMLFLVPS